MKILMLHNDYQQVGGETHSVGSEVAALRERGHEVKLLTVSNTELKQLGKLRGLQRATTPKFSFELVRGAIDQFQPDLVHAQNLFPLLGAGAIDALHHASVPWFRTLRNFRKRCLSANLFRDGKICTSCQTAGSAFPGVIRGCYRNSSLQSGVALVYGRHEMMAELRYPPRAYIAVSSAVGTELSHSLVPGIPVVVKPNAVQAHNGTNLQRSGILYVGRLEAHKGVDILLSMIESMPETTFTVVGEGPESEVFASVQARSGNVVWHKRLDNSRVLELMSASRIVIAPSKWIEPFGRVAVEALSMGALPIVGDRGGLAEIAAMVNARYSLSTDRFEVWVETASEVLSMDAHDFSALSAHCRNVYVSNYTTAINGSQLEDIYKRFADTDDR
ncbi:glycosyltransferase [Rhodococcus sp. PAMC28707]|nr:glycosyltransferase [Rhodococcus sp. PAMC28705]QCB58399.1 glycosyltransferase [Rhodococcus sp. PAMC28707]